MKGNEKEAIILLGHGSRVPGAGEGMEQVAAARHEGCRIVVVRRPARPAHDAFADPAALVRAVMTIMQNH